MQRKLFFIFLFIFTNLVQIPAPPPRPPGGPPGGGGGPGCWPPPCKVPVDGGAVFLMAAGIGYGAKKLRDAKMKKQTNITN